MACHAVHHKGSVGRQSLTEKGASALVLLKAFGEGVWKLESLTLYGSQERTVEET